MRLVEKKKSSSEEALVQVFVSLIENADKYASPGSAVTIRSCVREDELLVQILDRGPGIPQGELDRVFEKFYRLEGARLAQGDRLRAQGSAGTGLGLSISKGIIEAHYGRICAENRSGGGVVFTVALPLEANIIRPQMEKIP